MTIPQAIKSLTEAGSEAKADLNGREIRIHLRFREDVCLWVYHAEDLAGQCVDIPRDIGETAASRIILINLGVE